MASPCNPFLCRFTDLEQIWSKYMHQFVRYWRRAKFKESMRVTVEGDIFPEGVTINSDIKINGSVWSDGCVWSGAHLNVKSSSVSLRVKCWCLKAGDVFGRVSKQRDEAEGPLGSNYPKIKLYRSKLEDYDSKSLNSLKILMLHTTFFNKNF